MIEKVKVTTFIVKTTSKGPTTYGKKDHLYNICRGFVNKSRSIYHLLKTLDHQESEENKTKLLEMEVKTNKKKLKESSCIMFMT